MREWIPALRRNDMVRAGGVRATGGGCHSRMGLAGIQGCPRVDSGFRRNDMGAQAVSGRRAGVVIPAWG